MTRDRATLAACGPFETIQPPGQGRGVWAWFVACVYDGYEAEVVSRLADASLEAYSPHERVKDKRSPAGRQQALFPGYVFVRMAELGPFRPVRMTKYVEGMITNDGRPQPVRGTVAGVNVVEALRTAETLGMFDRTLKPEARRRFQAGQAVRIGGGPFAGFVAQIQSYTAAERVRVLLSMMGREVAVTVDEVAMDPA